MSKRLNAAGMTASLDIWASRSGTAPSRRGGGAVHAILHGIEQAGARCKPLAEATQMGRMSIGPCAAATSSDRRPGGAVR